MPFEGFVIRAITEELNEQITGGRINKIYQPTNTELVITVRNNRKNYSLLLSIHPSYARFHLTDDTYRNPGEPPMFCMLLRKHIGGAIIESIEQYDLERIVTFRFRAMNAIGDQVSKRLIVEIMGRHSNVILLHEQKDVIINCLKHVPPSQNRYRTLLPGATYKLPPSQNKQDLFEIEAEEFVRKLDFNAGKLDRQIVQTLTGVSPMIAKEIVHRAHLGSAFTYQNEFLTFQVEVTEQQFKPAIYENGKEDFHVVPVSYMNKKSSFTNANEMTDAFYSNKAERDRIKQQARDLDRLIKNELDKNRRKLIIHEKTIQKSQSAETYQKRGELLTAHMHLVQKGDRTVTVIEYYEPEQKKMTIELQSDKSPSENAQLLFNRYRKLAAAKTKAQQEIRKTTREIEYLENILQQVESARAEDLEEIREELREEGYLRKQKQQRRKRKKPSPEQFISSDGTPIFVGKNNRQNEYVTQTIANKDDIWLHTLNIPGSHVVIKSANPREQTLLEAAQLAAYFSKAQQSASVPVDYTKIRHVRKPTGAKPGFVTYSNQKTLYITPDEEFINAMKRA